MCDNNFSYSVNLNSRSDSCLSYLRNYVSKLVGGHTQVTSVVSNSDDYQVPTNLNQRCTPKHISDAKLVSFKKNDVHSYQISNLFPVNHSSDHVANSLDFCEMTSFNGNSGKLLPTCSIDLKNPVFKCNNNYSFQRETAISDHAMFSKQYSSNASVLLEHNYVLNDHLQDDINFSVSKNECSKSKNAVSLDHNYAATNFDKNSSSLNVVSLDHNYAVAGDDNDQICILFWNVNGKNRFFDLLSSESLFERYNVICFSETWIFEPTPCIKHKDFYFSSATETGSRPSGGLEIYSDPNLHSKLISRSPMHVCIQTTKFHCISVYYKPTTEFDILITDVLSAINTCIDYDSSKGIVLGGDFNLHFHSNNFQNLQNILSSFNIKLISSPHDITFVGHNNSSTPDHIFCSSNLTILKSSVLSRIGSDHLPLTVEIAGILRKTNKALNQKLDLKSFVKHFESISPHFDDFNPMELAETLHEILQSSLVDITHRRSIGSHRIESLKKTTKDALDLYHFHKSNYFKEYYLCCRRNLQKEIRLHKERTNERKLAVLLKETESVGIRALYKNCRNHQPSLSPHVPLEEWYKHFSNLYQTFKEPNFTCVPVVPIQEASYLTANFTLDEIKQAIKHQKSSAKGLNNISPRDIVNIIDIISPLLVTLFNHFLNDPSKFPDFWSSTVFFFIHKNGSFSDPANYRSLAIEDPILKIFNTCLFNRLSEFASTCNLLPTYQFGFRKKHSTISAVTILNECVSRSLNNGKRVYACFVDFTKAFDLIDRNFLCTKLQLMGVPTAFSKVIFTILQNLQFCVRSNDCVSPPFDSHNGVPQGDPLSPLLFSLFIADLPVAVESPGVAITNSIYINYILYADDLVLLSHTSSCLQGSLNKLETYCDKNSLTVSEGKTKCMTFYNGHCELPRFLYKNRPLEKCLNLNILALLLRHA